MFYTIDDVLRLARTFKGLRVDVAEELRGWRWNDYPVAYPYGFKLSVADIASGFCDTGRLVYVKYVLKARERPNWRVRRGSLIHAVFARAVETAKAVIYSGVVDGGEFKERFMEEGLKARPRILAEYSDVKGSDRLFDRLWSYAADTYASSLVKAASRSSHLSVDSLAALTVPLTAEFPIDGSLVGLAPAIRVDALLHPNIIVELKTRELHPDYELGLAGYALAYESQYEVPVDLALLVRVQVQRDGSFKLYERAVRLGEELRSRFLERRDRLAKIVEEGEDPGRPSRCHPDCPFQAACREVG